MGMYKSSVHNALNLEAQANCWTNRRARRGAGKLNKKLKWTYQKVVKMSLLNTSMFILLLLLVLEYLFICAPLLSECRCVTFLAQDVDDNAKAMNFELWWERWEQTVGQALRIFRPSRWHTELRNKMNLNVENNFIICEQFYFYALYFFLYVCVVVIVDRLMS